MTPTPNPDRRIGEEKTMNDHQTSEVGEMLPCPFCDDPDARLKCAGYFFVQCEVCRASSGSFANENEARRAWNTRAAESHLRAQLAEAEKALATEKALREESIRVSMQPTRNVLDTCREGFGIADGLPLHDLAWQVVAGYEMGATKDAKDLAALRGQLAEAQRRADEWREWANSAFIERDAAQARAKDLQELLTDAKVLGKHSVSCYRHMNEVEGDSCICGWQGIQDRIDAALATSPHRLAGRGE